MSADLFLSQNQLYINFNGENILLKSPEYPFAFHILPFALITLGSLLVLIFIKTLFQKDKGLTIKEIKVLGSLKPSILFPILSLDILFFAIRLAFSKKNDLTILGFQLSRKEHPMLFLITPPLFIAFSLSIILYFLWKYRQQNKSSNTESLELKETLP